MNKNVSPQLDLDALLAFAAVAKERNMRKAARTLNISQPPLSRKIRRLEENLGLVLFDRHSDGMELTEDGKSVLSIIYPFLEQASETAKKIAILAQSGNPKCALGLTTAFEQAVFSPYLQSWRMEFGNRFSVVRKESPKLVKDVAQGKLAAAFVALPLDTFDLFVFELNYSEKLVAVIPACWPEADSKSIALDQLNGKPMFWFQRKRNPSYFDYMMTLFNMNKYSPLFIEEPYEHDVLLARISFGEGWTLLPESFTVLPRDGIKFVQLNKSHHLYLNLGFIYKDRRSHFIIRMKRLPTPDESPARKAS